MSSMPEQRVVVSGVGISEIGRRTGRAPWQLTFDAINAAVEDAGLEFDDIDGLATFPGAVRETSPGFAGPNHWEIAEALRLNLNWQLQAFLGAGQIGVVIEAIMAVAAGLCRHAVVYRTSTESDKRQKAAGAVAAASKPPAAPEYSWLHPIGAVSAANHYAMHAQAYMDRFGMTRAQLGGIAIAQRQHAARNPWAAYKEPMSLEQYLEARMISDPLCLFDCDVPVDGSSAIVISSRETLSDLRLPVAVDAMATASRGRLLAEQWSDLTTMASFDTADQLWSRTTLRPNDIDCAQLYDGFSIMALMWIEAFGFCGRGEAGAFVEGGARIGPGGELPINTSGGQLSAGRLHGFGQIVEAVEQIRGEAGPRQVPDASACAVGVGGGQLAGALLLRSE